jgi:hypothetical protein
MRTRWQRSRLDEQIAGGLVRDRKGALRSTDGGDLREAVDSARHALDTRREIAADLRHAA